ncbi:40S ribosomal protein S12 [Cryomyces antarcticus]|uniref:40S ribosomal protein S12 n=1 Tax=Cryomyces antarcticus TaxID=329879 RepID=A0ABR0M0F9_9PEZI|nr:40S ribosomal protein S12 [Cryomyces antarcticus]
MSDNSYSKPANYSQRQPLAHQFNGSSTPPLPRNHAPEPQFPGKQNYGVDSGHLVPRHVTGRTNSDISTNGSDRDSLLELYKSQLQNPKGAHVGDVRRNPSLSGRNANEDLDNSAWIHRDKLAQIESRELEEAGFRVGLSSRSASRSNSRSTAARRERGSDLYGDDTNGDARNSSRISARDDKRQRMVSPIPAADEEGTAAHQVHSDFELRTPQEVAAEREMQHKQNRHHALRPSTSRIPLSKTSPVPVPNTFIERDSPLPRNSNGSGAWSGAYEEGIAFRGHRARSQSVGSQPMLDEWDGTGQSPPSSRPVSSAMQTSPQASPLRAKVPSKAAPTSGARKVTGSRVVSGPTKTRVRSSTLQRDSPTRRPASSSGTPSRPSATLNRPEGEAPWIATMYKPDPRLPPEQQMLPTHAKRMLQEQWEKEGKTGSVYDRDFELLHSGEFDTRELSLPSESGLQEAQKAEDPPSPWPLKSQKSETKSDAKSETRSEARSGGYKITPTISSPQIRPQGVPQRPVLSPKPSQPNQVTRLPEPLNEKSKEKKSSRCSGRMSDGEEPTSPVVAAAEEVEVSGDSSAGKGQMSVLDALKGALKMSLIHDGLARGLREASKVLDRGEAHMCVLNEGCEEEAYKKLVIALCGENKIPLIKVPDGKQLGEWAGLCQIDREGNARKVVNCSCVAVKDWGEDSQERTILMNYFKTEQ